MVSHRPWVVDLLGCTALGCTVLAVACADPRQAPPLPEGPLRRAGQVVARVNGAPILADDLHHQMRESSLEPRAALAQLVRFELLAQEARRRGLGEHPDVRWIEKRAAARLLVERDFGDSYTRDSIPPELIRRAYEKNKHRFVHPELAEVCHLLASAGPKSPTAQQRRARQLARRAWQVASAGGLSPGEFLEIPRRLRQQAEAGAVKLIGESLVTPRQGFTVEPFAAAAFALQLPGDLSPVVRTRFGYHVIYLKRRVPARDSPLAEVEQEVRRRVFEEARRIAFEAYVERLEARHQIEHHPDALATIEGQR